MLHELLTAHHEDIVARTRAKGTARSGAEKRNAELDEGIPLFLNQLSVALRFPAAPSPAVMREAAAKHGRGLWHAGFAVSQVVHCYGDVCQAVMELALELDTLVTAADFSIFNRCLDEATASAVTEYARQSDERLARKSTQSLGLLAHEFRNHLTPAMLAFSTLKDGIVGLEGGTSALLDRSLFRLQNLVERCFAEVRASASLAPHERLQSAAVDASSHSVSSSLAPEPGAGEALQPADTTVMEYIRESASIE